MVEKMVINNFNIPNCADFQYGNQEINPKCVTSQSNDKEVEILLNKNQV